MTETRRQSAGRCCPDSLLDAAGRLRRLLCSLHGTVAKPAPLRWNVTKTAFQIVLFWSFFLFFMPGVLYYVEATAGLARFRFASAAWQYGGIALFTVASALGLTSGWLMAVRGRGTPLPTDSARVLVIEGPYRYVRNPMGMSGLLQGAAVALYLGSPLVLAYVFAGWMILDFIVRPWEERDLLNRFGEDYRRYRQEVRCWLPRLYPYV